MNRGVWKILQTTRMVEVQMGKHNMAYIAGLESKLPNLLDSGITHLKLDIVEPNEKSAKTLVRCMNITGTKPCINQDKAIVVCLNQQTMTNKMSCQAVAESIKKRTAPRTHTTAVKMMYTHEINPSVVLLLRHTAGVRCFLYLYIYLQTIKKPLVGGAF